MRPKFNELVGAICFLVALMAVAWIALMGNETALGGLMTVLAAAGGYVYRGAVVKENKP